MEKQKAAFKNISVVDVRQPYQKHQIQLFVTVSYHSKYGEM